MRFLALFATIFYISNFALGLCRDSYLKMGSDAGVKPLNREASVEKLKTEKFDFTIIGGGIVGTATAKELAHRGYKVALVEREDFGSETSSRSTKLWHGGVRYVPQALKDIILKWDFSKAKLIFEGLQERAQFLSNAPHLSEPLQFLTPLYKWWEIPFYGAGLKSYDVLAGFGNTAAREPVRGRFALVKNIALRLGDAWNYFMGKGLLKPSGYVTPSRAKELFPNINPEGLKGAILYSDGKVNDARMVLANALTADHLGATVVNHMAATKFIKDSSGKNTGLVVKDQISGDEFEVNSGTIINATGPFGDFIRKLDNPDSPTIMRGSSGTHIVLDPTFSGGDVALLVPKTPDGRVIFSVPFEGQTSLGTTDTATEPIFNIKPTEKDEDFILETIRPYFNKKPTRADIKGSTTGIRPLVVDPSVADTANLTRDFSVLFDEKTGRVDSLGGKLTGSRAQAEATVDKIEQRRGTYKKDHPSTLQLKVVGGENYTSDLNQKIEKEYGIEPDIAKHLARAYGDRAPIVAQILKDGHSARLCDWLPYTEADVIYATLYESARTPSDILSRRVRLGFLYNQEAIAAVPRVVEIMGDLLEWNAEKRGAEVENALSYLSPR